MPRIGPIFASRYLQQHFNELGYVIVNLLNNEQVDELAEVYATVRQQHENIDLPFVSTSHSNDKELVGSVNAKILAIVSQPLAHIVPASKILFSNFLLKKCGPHTASAPHQDVTFVDESKYLSFSIWIPLTNVSEGNGCMKILQRSHLFAPYIRPNTSEGWKYRDVLPQIERDMISCPMKKGQALIFAHALIHGSNANMTETNRIAVVVACYPANAELLHYQTTSVIGRLDEYKMTPDAYIAYIKGLPPKEGKLSATVNVSNTPLSPLSFFLTQKLARLKALFGAY